tara:strand:+ start:322 stop:558 length:237 start_codon:yes stop_codon:yes gene_type:complete
MDLKPNVLTEYYFNDNILYTLSTTSCDSMEQSMDKIKDSYKGYKTYMTHADGDNYYVVKFVNNDKIFYIIQLEGYFHN